MSVQKKSSEVVKKNIISEATKVFANAGFDGASIEVIASKTNTSKRMIYYYFGDKSGLYKEVLETVYSRIREAEASLDLSSYQPVDALRALVSLSFDLNRSNPDFVRVLMNENIHQARTLNESEYVRGLRGTAKSKLELVYEKGVQSGVFREGLEPLKIRWMFSGLSFFNVSNQPSFSALFGDSLWSEFEQEKLKSDLVELLLRYVLKEPSNALLETPKQEDKRMINPDIETFLGVWNQKWSTLKAGATPDDRRRHFELIAHQMRLPTPEDVDCEQVHWLESKAGPVRVRVFRHSSGGSQPCLIYLHGGAWMQGSPETHWDITSRIASYNKQTVISVDYAKMPERPFPNAINQVDSVAVWAVANADMLGIDPNKIAVGGDSAGGNLAAALTLDMRGTDIKFTGQLLIYPACDFDQSRPSYEENYNGPLIQVKGMDQVNAMYCPNTDELFNNPRVAPLVATDHSNLPPAYVAVAQNDPLRDSGIAYAEKLTEAGVEVVLEPGEGLIHGYLRSMEYCSVACEQLEKMAAWLKKINEGG